MAAPNKTKVGDHTIFEVTIRQRDGSVLPLQTTSTREFYFKALATGEVIPQQAALTTDGSDGRMRWQDDGTMQTAARVGLWTFEGLVVLGDGSQYTTITPLDFQLLKGLSGP